MGMSWVHSKASVGSAPNDLKNIMGQIMGKLRKNHGWNVADSWVFQSNFSSIVSNALKNCSWVGIIAKFSSRKEWSTDDRRANPRIDMDEPIVT